MYLMSLVIAGLLFSQEPIDANSSAQPATSLGSPTVATDAPDTACADDRSAVTSPEAPATNSAPESPRVTPGRRDSRRVTPEELVARAISSTAQDELPGEPLSLLAALSNVRGQAERIGVVHAYWQSAILLAKYGVALDENRQLREFHSGTGLATSDGTVEAARMAAIKAQRRLAQAARLPKHIQLPTPSDRPHVRVYKTRFEEIFASSAPSERMRLIDRKLPLRMRIINTRASAVQAAEDALGALTDSHREKKAEPASVTAAIAEFARQRRSYLEAVFDYNQEIADYALNIVGQEITGRQLVATLIDVGRNSPVMKPRPGGATEFRRQPDVQRAEFTVPLDTNERGFWEPTPAVKGTPQKISPPALSLPPLQTSEGKTVSDLEKTGEWVPSRTMSQPPTASLENRQTEVNRSEMTSVDNGSPAARRSSARLPLVPVERTVFRLSLDDALPTPQYADLRNTEPAIQAGRLVADLFPKLEGNFDDCKLVDLHDCLADRSLDICHQVLNAYWLARLRACEYQAYSGRAEQLAALVPIALGRTAELLGAEDMLRLRATRLSTDADVLEAHARLLDAQYELTLAVESPLDSSWLLPRTSPRCGQYSLELAAQPRSLVESWPVRRLAVTIPTLSEAVMSRASTVVDADTDRSNAINQFATGTLSMDAAMDAIQKQCEHTLAFLDTVTAYNQSIAEYVVRTSSGIDDDVSKRILEPVDSRQGA